MRRLPVLLLCAWIALAADTPELTSEARAFIEIHFLAAKRAEAAEDFVKAVDEYETILKNYPKAVPEVYQNLGLVYYIQRNYKAAIRRLSEGLELKPAMLGARLFLGSSYLSVEQPEKALPHLRYAHKENPTVESANDLGLAYAALKQYDRAAGYFRFALDRTEQKEKFLYLIGDCYLKMSERIVNTLAEQNPDSKYDHLVTAKILDSQNWYQMAAREYLEAAKRDQWNASIFFPLARMLAILGLETPSQLALDRYRQLLPTEGTATLDPAKLPKRQVADVGITIDYRGDLRALPRVDGQNLPPLPLLNSDVNDALKKSLASDRTGAWKAATGHLLHSRWQEGIEVLEKIRRTPGDWLRDYLVATAYMWSDNYLKAEEVLKRFSLASQAVPAVQMLTWEVLQQLSFIHFNELLDGYPQSARARLLKGRTLAAQGKKEALEEYQKAIAADPADTEARIALADHYLSDSKYEEALAECERAVEFDPYSSSAKMRIGRIYIQLRQPAKGIPYLEDALGSDPSDAQARADLARGRELLGETEKAVEEYKRALELDPSLNRLHYVLGRIYRTIGKTELAEREYQIFQQNEAIDRRKHLDRIRDLRENEARKQEQQKK